jgi:hypothetical protein
MSLDEFVAGANISADNALGDGGDRLHEWMFSSGTETGRSVGQETFASAGAIVVGRRTFDLGKPHWDRAWCPGSVQLCIRRVRRGIGFPVDKRLP